MPQQYSFGIKKMYQKLKECSTGQFMKQSKGKRHLIKKIYINKMSKSRSQSSIPAFLQKTYDILEVSGFNNIQNPQLQDIVGWNEDGSGFLVKNVITFQDQVLPMYFKHRNFASFMNMYGFHKSRSDLKENEFIHPHFRKDQRNLLKKIKRKSGEHGEDQFALIELKPHRNQTQQDRQIQELITKQQELEKVCKILIEQNNKILQCNQQLRTQLYQDKYEQKYARVKEKKKMQKLQDYLMGQQAMNCIEDDPLNKRANINIYDIMNSDNEDAFIKKKVKEEDSESTIEKLENQYSNLPLMLTNHEQEPFSEQHLVNSAIQQEEEIIPLLGDQQLEDIYFE